ncbi:MAG: hypothetical protein A2X94_12335 [Bdellovibrionales bacterium GWB1_55_8]|nr:MAG: hypothetical protein A2X94_12335 [Bdellovibrionales bacterium GWB1_55_8]
MMPRITTYAISFETVKKASSAIQEQISSLLSLPSEYVTIAVNADTFIQDGAVVQGSPFVEICLFDRGEEQEDAIAHVVTAELRKSGCGDVDVYLTKLERRRYFENGKHF